MSAAVLEQVTVPGAQNDARRILLLDSGKEWGGGTNSMIELLKRIDRRRFAITPLFFDNYARGGDGDLRGALAEHGYALEQLPRLRQPLWAKLAKEGARGLLAWSSQVKRDAVFAVERAWRVRPDARRIAAMLRAGRYDLLYLNNQPSSNLEGLLAAEAAGVPVIQHCRIEADLNPLEVATLNRAARRVICVSHGVAESLVAQGVRRELCAVVPNGIDAQQLLPDDAQIRAQCGFASSEVVVGTVGSLVVRKRVAALLDAIDGAHAEVRGLVVGDGPQRAELVAAAQAKGLAGRVAFAGFQREPLPWLAAMDVFCLLSAREGLPRVILEAMLLGKPVIATDIPGSRELVRDGETGFLVPHDDAAALDAALARLVGDPALRARMGARGREIVTAEYSIESYVRGVERVFAEVLG